MSPHILVAAPIPALLGSLLLLQLALAPRALVVQQAIVAIVAITSALLYLRYAKPKPTTRASLWLLLGTVALVWAPLLGVASSSPHRWLGLVGFRIYIAPVVLPLFLLLWHRALSDSQATAASSIGAAALIGLGLLVQPDAAQLTAFALASVPVLGFSKPLRIARLLTLTALLGAAAVSWRQPDPFAPVPYVEGVFTLAASSSIWALLAAILSAALPITALAWLASRTGSKSVLAVMLYFVALYLLTPLQVTPVPLLGFGAGPIIGYFIMASQTGRSHPSAA
jgi:hypothetical protein